MVEWEVDMDKQAVLDLAQRARECLEGVAIVEEFVRRCVELPCTADGVRMVIGGTYHHVRGGKVHPDVVVVATDGKCVWCRDVSRDGPGAPAYAVDRHELYVELPTGETVHDVIRDFEDDDEGMYLCDTETVNEFVSRLRKAIEREDSE